MKAAIYPHTTYSEPLPEKLILLIDSGFWPVTAKEVEAQNEFPLIDEHVVHHAIPDEYRLYLIQPPFKSVEELCAFEDDIWREFSVESEFDLSKLIVIADFGLGSDSILVLDYQHSTEPALVRLAYSHFKDVQENKATAVAPSFGAFCEVLGID